MAVSPTVLTSGGTSADAASFNTASITPAANKPITMSVHSTAATTPNAPTITGNGLTWVQVATKAHTTVARRVTVFRSAGAAPSAGAVTIDFAGQTQTVCIWAITQWDGADETGTNGSGAIVQSGTAEGTAVTSLTVALGAFADPTNNAAFGAFFHGAAEDTTPGTGFSELTDQNFTVPNAGFETEWHLGEP